MNIIKIKKTSGNKYQIIFDDKTKVITYDEVILKHNLLYKKSLDCSLLNDINIETKYYANYYKCFKYVTNKIRSMKEISNYLEKTNVTEDEKKQIIIKLKASKLINDNNFAKAYIADHFNLTKEGPLKISKDLLEHDIDEERIKEEISKLDEKEIMDKLSRLMAKRKKQKEKCSPYILRQTLLIEFVNLGYGKEMVEEILNTFTYSNNSINKEYKTIYTRLSKKYKDQDLISKTKQKLYQKGYSSEEINNIE